CTPLRMVAERAARIAAEAPSLAGIRALLGDQRHRAVEPDREDLIDPVETCIGLAVLDVRSEAADPCHDRLALLRALADLARQREQPERRLERHVFGRYTLRNPGALRLLTFVLRRFAKLEIGPEPASLDGYIEARVWVLAKHLVGT